ncbi:MAG: hypothetical protein QF911_01395 [Candidatus Thalassarchaeaceae archaeon]|jgi:hypothetical protein|nr:hypothetical protein [Candidatus Thalassarchaeaceae archaeon]
MSDKTLLDEFLIGQSSGVHRSHRRLAKLVREAYPIGVPALIMKSSTDRLGASAGYSFHLGTPDTMLRAIASWLITEAGNRQEVLLKLVGALWKRHGREDVALAALLLANVDHALLGSDPWAVLASSVNKKEPVDALLLSIEELYRAKHPIPTADVVASWCNGTMVQAHLALITVFVAYNRGMRVDSCLKPLILDIEIPPGDSLLGRIRGKVVSMEPQN